ncbi:MAG: LPS assembly lipoprotein LptE [Thermodesulfobacteriota bacterium]
MKTEYQKGQLSGCRGQKEKTAPLQLVWVRNQESDKSKSKFLFFAFSLLSSVFLLLSSCGYHIAGKKGTMPGGLKSISVPFFSNKTAKPEIESVLTPPFVEELVNIGLVKVVEHGEGILKGTINKYAFTPISFDRNDVVTEYRVTVVLDLILIRGFDGEVLWEGKAIQDSEDFAVDPDIVISEANEREALNKIAVDLARSFKERIFEELKSNSKIKYQNVK